MAEYIERESLAADGWHLQRHKYGEGMVCVENMNILDIPAADVQPVRHGRWSRIDYEPIGHDYICSVCGWRNDMASHYCPNCGAKMDGEKEKENAERETVD